MRNRLYDYICIFILLEILQPISHAKIVDDTRRTKREISVAEVASQPRGNDNYGREASLEKGNNGDLEKDDTYLREKRKISAKRSANPVTRQSNAEKSIDIASRLRNSNEESDYAEEEAGEEKREPDDKDVDASDLVRSPRDVNVEKYADQDERSSLYDDYEAKDVAKRGVLGGPGDYEEAEDDSPGILEDAAALEEREDEGERYARRDTRESDSRMKRDRETTSETLDKSESRDPEEPKVAENPLTSEVSRVESSKSFNRRASPPGDPASTIKGSAGSNDVISRSSDSTENEEPTSVITSSDKDEGSNAEYGKRVEEEIQRKIESIKEEIKRDIEAQQRIRDIEENNVRFDELRDQEDEGRQRDFEGEPIEKRQLKRSIREIAAPSSSSERSNEKRCLKGERRDKLQRRSSEESENLKRRFAVNRDKSSSGQAPSMGLVKRKRERVRQTFLVNNDRAKRRRSRSYTSPSDRTAAGPENELFTDLNSYRHTDDGMLQASSPVAGEDEIKDGEMQNPAAERSNSLASLTGSSQELSPRLAREYKEAFGGLQSESGSALARFKRIKRVLGGPDAKI